MVTQKMRCPSFFATNVVEGHGSTVRTWCGHDFGVLRGFKQCCATSLPYLLTLTCVYTSICDDNIEFYVVHGNLNFIDKRQRQSLEK